MTMTKTQLDNRVASITAASVSCDAQTRLNARNDAFNLLVAIPRDLWNNPHNEENINTLMYVMCNLPEGDL